MKTHRLIQLIKVDEYSVTAKYLQIANSIIKNVGNGKIVAGDLLPSINELSFELDIARDTVERAYKYLRELNIIDSVPRKGYFISNAEIDNHPKIFLLFNKLSEHKKIIYDSFVATLGNDATIDFYVYNNDLNLFKKLIAAKGNDYTHYVILPHFIEAEEKAKDILNELPKEKLIMLDKHIEGITGEYAGIYENFEVDIYNALKEAYTCISKYKTIKVVFPEHSYYPKEIKNGISSFCAGHGFLFKSVKDILHEELAPGDLVITVMEDDLVTLIERILASNLRVGTDIGVISYNETRIKKLILEGITTVSTDFAFLGKSAAEMVLSNAKEQIGIPFHLTLRKSV
ncbi:MAG: GntR family transcriptional regulator [Edaphocola sp.]